MHPSFDRYYNITFNYDESVDYLKKKETESTVVAIQPNLQDVVSETPVIYTAFLLSEFLILIKRGLMLFPPPPWNYREGKPNIFSGLRPWISAYAIVHSDGP